MDNATGLGVSVRWLGGGRRTVASASCALFLAQVVLKPS